jgi:choline dehydrogenase-like flavoprotein
MDGKRAIGVEYRDAQGQMHELQATREVIVSAGALQSPQLLMLSGIGPGDVLQKHGISVVQDTPGVGQNLQDHIDIVHSHEAGWSRGLLGLSFSSAWTIFKGLFTWNRYRRGVLTTNLAEGTGFIKSNPAEDRIDTQLVFICAKLMDHGRKILLGDGYSIHVAVLRPKSRGTVSLASADPLAAPQINTNFLAEQDDVDRLVRGFKMAREIMHQSALMQFGGKESRNSAKARSDSEIEQFIRNHADCAYHAVGTCRMGNGPLDVVDAQLRVKGIDGLRVVDASIMPNIVSGNTNAPTIMIAEKAADMIKASAVARV